MRKIGMVLLSLLVACGRSSPRSSGCTACEIVMQRVGEMSDSSDLGTLPDQMVYAERDRAGRLITVSRQKDGVLVYGQDGRLIRRLGRSGDGPGEFRMIRRVLIGPNDSIFVSDWSLRVNVFAPDLSFARVQTVAHPPSLILDGGQFIVVDQIRTSDTVGFPLHSYGADGAFLKSFGTDTPQYRADLKLITNRLAAKASKGGVWSVAPGRYRIERWDSETGTRMQSISVQSDWFKELATWPADERIKPPAVIEALWEDQGMVWLLFRVADLEWTSPAQANVERVITNEDYESTYDWVIEAVDPASGKVVASKRFRNILWGRPPSTVVVSQRSSDASGTTYDVWKPTLQKEGSK